jgi:hypothetical protein
MFLRKCRQRKNGQEYAYWQLVESYRTQRGPRQRVVAHLGDIDECGRVGLQILGKLELVEFLDSVYLPGGVFRQRPGCSRLLRGIIALHCRQVCIALVVSKRASAACV